MSRNKCVLKEQVLLKGWAPGISLALFKWLKSSYIPVYGAKAADVFIEPRGVKYKDD